MDHFYESERIRKEYQRRAREIQPDYYSLAKPVNLFFHQQRHRVLLPWIARIGIYPFYDKKICDIGCGSGDWLLDFIRLGINPNNIFGIDLDEARIKVAQTRFPSADIRMGNASMLPWKDNFFDIVLQSTVFTSILDDNLKRKVAEEMIRVTKSDGVIIWYDFSFNNPKNPNVKGIEIAEIKELFPGMQILLKKVTLAPPIARMIVPISWIMGLFLEKIPFLRTHYLGIIRKM